MNRCKAVSAEPQASPRFLACYLRPPFSSKLKTRVPVEPDCLALLPSWQSFRRRASARRSPTPRGTASFPRTQYPSPWFLWGKACLRELLPAPRPTGPSVSNSATTSRYSASLTHHAITCTAFVVRPPSTLHQMKWPDVQDRHQLTAFHHTSHCAPRSVLS